MTSESTHRIHFLNTLATVPIPEPMLRGVPVLQVAANGKTQPSKLFLSANKFTLTIASDAVTEKQRFFGNNKPVALHRRDVDIGEMDRIQRGQSTQQFEKAKKKSGNQLVHGQQPSFSSRSSNASTISTTTVVTTTGLLDPQRSFSIIFRGAHTLDLMAESYQARNILCSTLDRLLSAYQHAKVRVAREVLLLRYVWLSATPKQSTVQVSNLRRILTEMNCGDLPTTKDLNAAYEHFGKVIGLSRQDRRKGLTFEQTATFLHKTKRDSWRVKPVNMVWNDLFGETMKNGKLRTSVSDHTFLEQFAKGLQGNTQATIVDVRKVFHRLHQMEIAHTNTEDGGVRGDLNRISKDQFEAFLLAAENDAFLPRKEQHNPADMNQPLSEYWINSSHNTYLIGDQYTSHSSVEMYSNALYRGCRCLELDIWDGGKEKDGSLLPVVWHGHTMTTKIKFVEILRTIKVFLNFHPDSYPIILSFENHCSIPYQEVLAEQLIRVFGDTLYVPTEASLHGPLPSPLQLQGMVVIKGRRPDGTEAEVYDSDDEDLSEDESNTPPPQLQVEQRPKKKRPKHGVAPELARLTLLHGTKYKSFEESIRTPHYFMHSFSEKKASRRPGHAWTMYNQTHMSRTYPAGSRVDSSNYNPLLAWSRGAQLVALNFQTQDQYLRLNDGRFRENGNCGYVLKPSALMMNGSSSSSPKNGSNDTLRLSVKVLSGSCLPKPKGLRTGDCIDPYIKVAVFDVKNDENRETCMVYQTDVVQQNGFFPIWQHSPFKFRIDNWPVAMLQLTVYDKRSKDEFIASSSIPVSCLRPGVRSVKLYDATNTRSGAFDFAALLLHIKIGQAVAEI